MKSIKTAALIVLAAATTAASMSGCGLFGKLLNTQKETAPATVQVVTDAPVSTQPETVAPTAAPVTAAPLTEAPVVTEPPTEAPKSAEVFNGAVMINDDIYTDEYLGITFYVPEWKGKVYAKGELNEGKYSLVFLEATNYRWGVEEKGGDNLGMLFTLYTDNQEADGENVVFPAGSEVINGKTVYLTYFKPTDVRFNYEDDTMSENYQAVFKYQREYCKSGVVAADRNYEPSSNPNAVNLNKG